MLEPAGYRIHQNLIKLLNVSAITLFSIILPFKSAQATHAMGMDLTYKQLSQDSFLITLAFYRDCSGVNAPGNATLRIRSDSCNYNYTTTLPRIGSGVETTPVCTSLVTQCNGGSFPGSEEYIYQKIVVLPAQCSDWVLSNEICCRNNAITTINTPGNQKIYVEARVNNFYMNSSPIFSNPPVPFVCSNQSYCFNNGAIDSEGDSLVYSLVTPRNGINADDTITFNSGFSKFDPITSSPAISLDSVTGDLCMFPTDSTQIGVLAILVQEYRNGILISSIMRDIQLRIIGCPNGNSLPTASGIDSSSQFITKVCANSNLSFQVYSADQDSGQVVTMAWNQAIQGASFTISSGNRPVGSFSWTPTINEVRSQPYCFTVTVSDDNCPFNGQQVFSYCIYVVGVAAILDSLFDPVCAGSCDGRATVRIVNGITPFTYQWDDTLSQTTSRATGLCSGTYSVVGVDSTGCTTTTTITLSDPNPILLDLDSVQPSCNGYNDGMGIVKSITNGFSPFSYQWEISAGLQTADTAKNLAAGTYSVVVTDSNNCQATDSITVTEPGPLVLSMINLANVSCNGFNDGQATVTVTGGTQPFSYQWDSLSFFQTNDTAFNLLAGTHRITVTDTNGCVKTDSVTITEPASAITLTLTTVDINCTGDSTGSATVVPSGGSPPYSYAWSANTGNQTTATASNLFAGTYSVIVSDTNNCVALPNIIISQPLSALVISPIDSFVECNGFANGVAGVNVSGGSTPYTFLWDASAGSQTTQYASNLVAGTYKVNVADSLGCNDSVLVQVLQSDTPLLVIISNVNVSCNNGNDGSAFVTISGGKPNYTIQWDSASGFQTGDTAFNLSAGTYQVSIVDSFGCTIDTGITVTEPPPLLTLTTNSTNVACFGDSTGTASVVVSGGTPPYVYVWSANAGGQTTDTAIGLSAGTYFVTVYDSNLCVTSPGIVISEPSTFLSAQVSSQDVNCFSGNDGFAVVKGVGGTGNFTYQWDSLANAQTGDTAFNLSAQTYGVSVTDSLNCTFDTSIAVSQPSVPLQISLSSSPVLCFSGTSGEAYVNISGGTTPYTILWSVSAGSQTNDTAVGLTSGYHLVIVTDTNNCSISDSVFVGGPPEPLISSTSSIDVSCFEGSDGKAIASGSGGTPPYTYLWDSNTGNQANDTAFNLSAGTYSVTITDFNLCDTSFSVTINEPLKLNDSIVISSNYNGSSIKCFGDSNGAATAFGIGGTPPYQFLWDSTANNQNTATAVNLSEGIYSVIITDSNGCSTTGFISLSSPQKMGFSLAQIRNISCYGGSDGMIQVAGFGGTSPYQYSWNTSPAVKDSLLDSVPIGSYMVTVTDTNACTYDTTFTLIQADTLYLDSLNFIDTKCFNGASGTASAYPNGGTPPYSYLWQISSSVFQITQTAVNLPAGTFSIVVTDDKNCTYTDSVTINEPTEVLVTTSVNDTVCAGSNVSISASAQGGDSTFYQFLWLPPRPDSLPIQNITPIVTTNYSVRAMDAQGCTSNPALITIFVRNMDKDTMRVFSTGDVCAGDTSTVVGFHNGPFGNYSYNWDFGKTGFGPHEVSPDTATYYKMTVSDICGNELSDSVLINVFPNPDFYLDSIVAIGCNPLNVQFDDTVNTMANLSYIWQFGDGNGSNRKNPSYTYDVPGTYNISLEIKTENNCSSDNLNKPSLVIVYPSPTAGFDFKPLVVDMRDPTYRFNNLSSGASSYVWHFGDGDSSITFSPEHTYGDTGTYVVTLISTSADGCKDVTRLNVFVKAYYKLEIPNAFAASNSSNGGDWRRDPEGNRIFYPYTENPDAVKEFEMLIFNRWGELIFESNSIFNGWDGFYRGKASPQEVYVYKISLRWENGQSFEKMGDVTLFR